MIKKERGLEIAFTKNATPNEVLKLLVNYDITDLKVENQPLEELSLEYYGKGQK